MTTHPAPVELTQDQPPLPNQHFSSWLRGQTTLFIGQIIAILTFVLFVAEEIYYVSYAGQKGELLKPLTIKLIVDVAHIVFVVVFILVLIKFMDDNDRGSHRVNLVFERVFKEADPEEIDQHSLKKSKEQLKRFKVRFLWFWIGMLALYVCFAGQHGYQRATREAPEEPVSKAHVQLSTTKNFEGKQETLRIETDHQLINTPVTKYDDPSLEPLRGTEIVTHLILPFVVFSLNNITVFILFLCFLIVYIPESKMKTKYGKHKWGAFAIVVVLTLAFPSLAWLIAYQGFTRAEWNTYSAIFDSLSGVVNAIVLALLIARLDSKLVGLPSWLISILYSYAAAQPLFIVFELNQTAVFEKITTAVLIFVFVAKIYFFFIVTYALQTGKLLNYLLWFPILHNRIESKVPAPELDSGMRYTKSSEGWFMRALSYCERKVHQRLKRNNLQSIGAEWVSTRLRSRRLLSVSAVVGVSAIVVFLAFSIWSILRLPGPPLFHAGDLRDPSTLAIKLSDKGNSLSRHLRDHFPPGTLLQLHDHNSQSFQSLEAGLIDGLNRAIKHPKLFDQRDLSGYRLQGNALVAQNRLFLERAYAGEIASAKSEKNDINSSYLDLFQLGLISAFIVVLFIVRNDNRYGGARTYATLEKVFKSPFHPQHTPEEGKKQLTKFKEYFFYFWCAMLLLYLVFYLKHSEIFFNLDSADPIQSKIRILLYPFLEFLFSSLNSLFIFWCFVVLRSPAFDEHTVTRQRLLINYSSCVTALLMASFPLLLFVVGPNQSESNLRDYATVFDGIAGTLSAVVWALLIARMNSKLFGLSTWAIVILFVYAGIQPLFVVFSLNDPILNMVQTAVLFTALCLKVCFFLIIVHSLQSGKALNYVVCFPFLKERVDSILENQFEIRLARFEDKFTFSILRKNRLRYSTTARCETRQECDDLIDYVRIRMRNSLAYRCKDIAGTYWVEVRSGGPWHLICESIPLRSEEEARELINESIEKIPYCKYNRV